MLTRFSTLWRVLVLRVAPFAALATLAWGANDEEGLIRLRLKWHHQFQFAGYYAAQSQGYYADEGLKVEISEGLASRSSVTDLLAGEVDFAVSDTDVVLARLQGKPVVVCAAIFQHSPYVIMSRADRAIHKPGDLVGARVMLSEDQGATQFRAMLMNQGIDAGKINILPHSWNLDDLISGRVDAMSAYSTAEPMALKARGVEPAMLRTLDYGVDFYGDTLFTNEEQIAEHPERTAAFVRASLRGWAYAMSHREELADYILKLRGVAERGVTREQLLSEADAMQPLILPEIVEIGHMDGSRWQRIANIFARQGLAPSSGSLEGFMYEPNLRINAVWVKWAERVAMALGCGGVLVSVWIYQMRRIVTARTRELREQIKRREKIEAELRTSEERLKVAQSVGGIGDWKLDVATGRIEWSETLFQLFQRDPAKGTPTLDEMAAYFHPEDLPRREEYLKRAVEKGESYAADLRVRLPDGTEAVHGSIGRAVKDASGRVIYLHGVTQDITQRKLAEERIRTQLHELERWRDVTLGREDRIHELKQEVNELLAEAAKPPRYAISARFTDMSSPQ